MAGTMSSSSWFFMFSLIAMLLATHADTQDNRKTYIVYMGNQPSGEVPNSVLHMSMLQKALGSNRAADAMLHSFKRSFNGFVVKLADEEVGKIAELEGVVSVFLNGKKQLHTTRSWDFLGFPQQATRSTTESDIIVGVLDSGIWPDSSSFDDSGFGPPPTKWKGTCHNITCNKKIIGAKYYRIHEFKGDDIQSPIDSNGHGTHTASTIAGGLVSSASLNGLGLGTARGGVPSARIAVYKVCWSDHCYDADILAAFDDAIADGVDIISLSVGGNIAHHYFNDSIAIGAFHAMRNGILTSMSAGNSGPGIETITNFSPWSLSVAASTIDRKFFTKLRLGDNLIYEGISINTYEPSGSLYPLIYGGDAPNVLKGFDRSKSRLCFENSLDPDLVKNKIVLCDGYFGAKNVGLASGAAGIVMHSNGIKDYGEVFALPASHINTEDANSIYTYMNTRSNPTATILKSTTGNDTFAPYVASFSSRGPNPVTLDILKPDIAAPGVEILAAWPANAPPSEVKGDKRQVQYNIISGTSMACPHATGVAAYIKSFHPTWSPAAIKSAIMTTATPMNPKYNPEAEFAYGAGHIDPSMALNPGLVYDASESDYVNFLCGQGYDTVMLQRVTGDSSTCVGVTDGKVWDLNYPSFAVSTTSRVSISRVFTRTVTNVGSPTSIYNAIVNAPAGLDIKVNPSSMSFSSIGQKKSFQLTVQGSLGTKLLASASLIWDDGKHRVRSPITVFLVESK